MSELPGSDPVVFKPELVPHDMLLHSGVFSPELDSFYYTVSGRDFQQFDVKVIHRRKHGWSAPEAAFFNSEYNEHGTSYSPDGRHIYFTSTRPVLLEDEPETTIPDTWHLWRSKKIDDQWSEPTFVDIPNLRDRLISHPSIAQDGTLYMHAGDLEYSELDIYSSAPDGDGFQDAIKLPSTVNQGRLQCTPFIAPDQRYLIFEKVPDLYISRRDAQGHWAQAEPLGEGAPEIGRGNPYVTPDGRFLFFAAGKDPSPGEPASWSIYWRSTEGLGLHP